MYEEGFQKKDLGGGVFFPIKLFVCSSITGY